MRILFFSTVYPRAYDLTRGTYCHNLCKALAAENKITVISPNSWIDGLRNPDPHSATLATEVGEISYPWFYYPPGMFSHTLAWWMWNSVIRMKSFSSSASRPDAILSYWAHPDGAVAVRLGQKLKIPVGVIVGGSDVLILMKNAWRRQGVIQTLQAANAVFTVNQDLRNKCLEYGVDPSRVHVNSQGVDPAFCPGDQAAARQRLGLPLDTQLILWVGQMAPVKGLENLLQAFSAVVARQPNTQLLLVGRGPEQKSLEETVARTNLKGKVRFVGPVAPSSLPDWYRAADLFALSSLSEGIPNVLRESLACGTPYVATNVGGIAELSSHPALTLVPPNDPPALAHAIIDALARGARIEENVIQRGWKKSADGLLQLLLRRQPEKQSAAAC